MSRQREALAHLEASISLSRDEFRNHHREGGDMLMTGLLTSGYAHEVGDRIAVTEQGRRYLGGGDD